MQLLKNNLTVKEETSGVVTMLIPEDIEVMLDLAREGWSIRRIAKELRISRSTVSKYLNQGGWQPYRTPNRDRTLKNLQVWIRECFLKHHGNAEVVRQELIDQHGLNVSLRTVEREVKELRRELKARDAVTIRFETPPGKQLQIDFGSMAIEIESKKVKCHLFVATLGYSRRIYIALSAHERQSAWMEGLEGAFRHFHGVPDQVLIDNARALVKSHNRATGELVFNERFLAFAQYWGFKPKVCAPYRPQTKGKDERAVGYVKRNAIGGRTFISWESLKAHLARWMRDVSDVRIHGTCKERPIDRYNEHEADALKPLNGRPPYLQIREARRIVQRDGCIEIDGNFYSVPWRHIGQSVVIQVVDGEVIIFDKNLEIARHQQSEGYRERRVERCHFEGIVKSEEKIEVLSHSCFDRSLAVYQEFAGGRW